jgi:hypothetical protein
MGLKECLENDAVRIILVSWFFVASTAADVVWVVSENIRVAPLKQKIENLER